MTHFIARFPHIIDPVINPRPEDYRDAAEWYRQQKATRYAYFEKAKQFDRVYRMLKWAQKPSPRSEEDECA